MKMIRQLFTPIWKCLLDAARSIFLLIRYTEREHQDCPLQMYIKRLYLVKKYRFYGKRFSFLVFLSLLCLVYITRTTTTNQDDEKCIYSLDLNITNNLVHKLLQKSVSRERGTGCNMPKLDPFSKEMTKFMTDMPKIVCKGVDWVDCHGSECYVVKEILDEMQKITCFYRDIIFITDKEHEIGQPVTVTNDDKYHLSKSDNVKVSCTGVKKYGFSTLRWFGHKSGFRPITPKIPPGREDTMDVMILIFDSTSRNNFIRRMPKSYRFLTKELEAIQLNSYNIVGDGTTAAMLPILTGKTELELPEMRKKFVKDEMINNSYFIFDMLKADGYRTAYYEDMPFIGTFQYRYNGFQREPTDHYLMPLFLEDCNNTLVWEHHCIGAIPIYAHLLNMTKKFLQLPGKHFCLTFISHISHDNINLITTSDDDVAQFLVEFKRSGRLENTLLIVMGDHGFRFLDVRETIQGKLEERLPLMSINLPEKLKLARPEALKNLKANVDVLTTPFDIHATILDVLGMTEHVNKYTVPGSDLPRSMSILRPIPKSRSCGEAGVLPHWCACTVWRNLPREHALYTTVAEVLADYINNITKEVRSKCVLRHLISIEYVLQQTQNDRIVGFKRSRDYDGFLGLFDNKTKNNLTSEYYQAKIVMDPGRAVFEGSMHYVHEEYFIVSESDISRITAYGDEPSCVSSTHPHLRKYCYCRSKLQGRLEKITETGD